MSHESHVYILSHLHVYILSHLQVDASCDPSEFLNCTVGRIIRVDANNGNEKKEPTREDNAPKKFNFTNCAIGHVVTISPSAPQTSSERKQ